MPFLSKRYNFTQKEILGLLNKDKGKQIYLEYMTVKEWMRYHSLAFLCSDKIID